MQNTKSSSECCGACYFFRTGKCRRFPPPFPDVRAGMWCGEYRGRGHSKELQDFIQQIIDGADKDVVTWPIEQPKWPGTGTPPKPYYMETSS